MTASNWELPTGTQIQRDCLMVNQMDEPTLMVCLKEIPTVTSSGFQMASRMAEMKDSQMAACLVGTKDRYLVETKGAQMASSLVEMRAASLVGTKADYWAVSWVVMTGRC